MSQFLRPTFFVTEWKSPGTVVNVDRDGKTDWSDVNNVKLQNDTHASDSIPFGTYNDWLRCTNFGFTTDDIRLPYIAVVGIEVQIDKYGGDSFIRDSALYLLLSGVHQGDDKADTITIWQTSDTDSYVTYGGPVDEWNSGLRPQDIRDSSFGLEFSAQNTDISAVNAFIDHIRVRVYCVRKRGDWLPEPADTDWWDVLDEASPNDSDYVWIDGAAEDDNVEVKFTGPSGGVPGTGTGTIRWRQKRIDGAKTTTITAYLVEGSTVRSTSTAREVVDTIQQEEHTVTQEEMDTITDWNNLHVTFAINVSGGGKASDPIITWDEFEIPDAAPVGFLKPTMII